MKTVFKVVIPFAAVVCACYCEDKTVPAPDLDAEKQIFDSEERRAPKKEIDFSKSPLFKLDEKIRRELGDPKPLDVSFEVKLDVLRDLVEYEKNIKELYEGVVKNIKSAVELAKELLCQDGPKFLREDIDEEELKKVYNWDDGNIEHLHDLFKDIRSVYNSITVSLKEKPTVYEVFFSKQHNTYA